MHCVHIKHYFTLSSNTSVYKLDLYLQNGGYVGGRKCGRKLARKSYDWRFGFRTQLIILRVRCDFSCFVPSMKWYTGSKCESPAQVQSFVVRRAVVNGYSIVAITYVCGPMYVENMTYGYVFICWLFIHHRAVHRRTAVLVSLASAKVFWLRFLTEPASQKWMNSYVCPKNLEVGS